MASSLTRAARARNVNHANTLAFRQPDRAPGGRNLGASKRSLSLSDLTEPAKTVAASLTLRGALAMALAFVASRLGIAIPDDQVQLFADAVVQIVFYGGLLAVGIGRARAKAPLQ